MLSDLGESRPLEEATYVYTVYTYLYNLHNTYIHNIQISHISNRQFVLLSVGHPFKRSKIGSIRLQKRRCTVYSIWTEDCYQGN
jgi:hypothetical protein